MSDLYITLHLSLRVLSVLILDSQLLFKRQIKKNVNRIKYNLSNLRFIRNNPALESAKLYFDTMIMSYVLYCVTSWAWHVRQH